MKTIKCGYKLLRDSNIYHLYHLSSTILDDKIWLNAFVNLFCILPPSHYKHFIWIIYRSWENNVKEKKRGPCLEFFCFAPDSKIFHLKSLDFVPWLWLWNLVCVSVYIINILCFDKKLEDNEQSRIIFFRDK